MDVPPTRITCSGTRVEHGGYQPFPLALLGIGQIEAAVVDFVDQVLLIPQRIAALDQWDGTHAPVFLRFVDPFQRARIPRILLALRLTVLWPQHVEHDDEDAGREDEGADGRDEVQQSQPISAG